MADSQFKIGSGVFFGNCLVLAIALVIFNLPSVIYNGSVYFYSIVLFGVVGFYFGGKLQAQHDTHHILERVLRRKTVSHAYIIAGLSVNNTEIAALFNEIIRAFKPEVMEKVRETFKGGKKIGAGYHIYVNKLDLEEQHITFTDVKLLRKDYMEDTEILLAGKLYISGDPEVDISLKNPKFGRPDVEGIINKFDINIGFFCKIDLGSKIISIWFSKKDVATDIDMDIDVTVFPLALDFITECIVKSVFQCHTEETPLVFALAEMKKKEVKDPEDQIIMLEEGEHFSEERIPNSGILHISNIRGKDLAAKDGGNVSDPYLKIEVESNKFKTAFVKNTLNPHWKEQFNIPIKNTRSSIKFVVKDFDWLNQNDYCGYVIKQVAQFIKHKGKQRHQLRFVPEGELYLDIEWFPENK